MFPHSVPTLAHTSKVNSFRVLIAEQLTQLKKQLEQVDRKSPKGLVHDLRVLSRRLRASLAVAESAEPSPALKRLRKRVEALTEVLGPVRSLDVAVSDLKKRMNASPPSLAALLGFVAEKIRKHRRKLKRRLPDAIAAGKIDKALLRVDARKVPSPSLDPKKIQEVLSQELLKASERVQDDFRTFRKKGKIKDLHALRIELKKWRYLCEMEEKIFPSGDMSDRLIPAKELQDRLGLIHDREALMEAVNRPPIKRRVKRRGNAKILKTFLKDLKTEMKREMEDFRRQGEKAIMELTHFAETGGPASIHA